MNSKKKIALLAVSFLVCIVVFVVCFSFAGCVNKSDTDKGGESVKYNATIVSAEEYTFSKEFLSENHTYGAFYDEEEQSYEDTTSPYTRTHLIINNSSLQEVFSDFPETDFKRDMVIVHGFTTTDHAKDKITGTEVYGNKLEIKYGTLYEEGPHAPDATRPRTQWIVIKIDKLDVEEVELLYIGSVKFY